jgi:hypothetical protein
MDNPAVPPGRAPPAGRDEDDESHFIPFAVAWEIPAEVGGEVPVVDLEVPAVSSADELYEQYELWYRRAHAEREARMVFTQEINQATGRNLESHLRVVELHRRELRLKDERLRLMEERLRRELQHKDDLHLRELQHKDEGHRRELRLKDERLRKMEEELRQKHESHRRELREMEERLRGRDEIIDT